MANYEIVLEVNGRPVKTLADILPERGPMKMLVIAKTPAPISVAAGHYFQGIQGRAFWNRLREYQILGHSANHHEDEMLLGHGYGITDIVKAPRGYGNEPSDTEYRAGSDRILSLVRTLRPEVLMFVYKRVLDRLLAIAFDYDRKAQYGFNPSLDALFGSRVFVFPMPGTPCTRAQAHAAMEDLAYALRLAGNSTTRAS